MSTTPTFSLNAEVLAIGDELTSGQRVDTNSAWLSRQLGDLGIRVLYHTTCADDLSACTTAFAQALARADVVVSTGGLGPTADDLTRDAIAAAIGQPLELRASVLEQIRAMYARRGRDMPPSNQVQAQFPRGSEVIPNPHGTAPGIHVDFDRSAHGAGQAGRSRLFAVPGVPAEMKQMWAATVLPKLRGLYPSTKTIRHLELKCFGVGESQLEAMLPDLVRRGRSPSVGITVHRATITLRVTAEGSSEQDCLDQMGPTVATIRECLGDLVFGEAADELQHAVLRQLERHQATVATAELGTAGRLAQWLHTAADQTGCRRFRGGLVLPSLAELQDSLQLPPPNRELDESLFWQRVAAAVGERFVADYALVISDFPSVRTDSTTEKCWLGLATPAGHQAICKDLAGHPDIIADRCAKQSLDWLRSHLALRAK